MKKPKFGGQKPNRPRDQLSSTAQGASEDDPDAVESEPELKDVWCVCTIYSDGGSTRDGMLLGISDTHARVRFPDRVSLRGMIRIKASRVGLNRSAQVTWHREFDAGLEFVEDE